MIPAQYRKNLTWEGWGKCAPTHTRKNRAGLPPPSVRATRRHDDGRKQARNLAYKRHFYTSRPNEPTATKKHDTRPHTPPQGRRGQTSDKSDDERTPRDHLASQPERPPTSGRRKTASGHRQTAGDAERATLRHHAHALTHHERRRICTHESATRVVMSQFYIIIYIILLLCASLYILFVFIYYSFFLLAVYMVLFAPLFRVCIMRACDIAAPMYIYAIFMYIYL